MTDSSRSQAIAAPAPTTFRPISRGAQGSGDSATTVRFTDVLAETTAPVIRRDRGGASPEQMFESKTLNTKDRRKAELRRDYRGAVDRHSAARAQERTGVKARRSQSTQHETTTEGMAPLPVKDPVERNPSSLQQAAGARERQLKTSTSPEKSNGRAEAVQGLVSHGQRSDGRTESAGKENQTPSASATPGQSRQVGSASLAIASDSPQAARELARLLASPTALSTERDATSLQSVIAGRSNPASTSVTKDAKDIVPKGTSPSSTTQSKPPQSSNVTEFERLIRLVRAQSGRQSSTRLLLDPPALGKVHVRVIVEGDRVEVGVETENDSARQLISERAVKLKNALEEHGFVIDRFDVTTNQSGLFGQHFLAGQEAMRPGQDQNGSGNGRGFSARLRGASGVIQAAAAVKNENAARQSDMGLDIQV